MSAQPLPAPGRVVVGVDGSAPSVAALRWAARIGTALGLEVEAVLSWDYPAGHGLEAMGRGWNPEADAAATLAATVDTAFGEAGLDGLRTDVRSGNPVRVLLEASEGAELLVVGSRGRGGFVGLLLGSVSTQCAAHARCPVVVVHGDETIAP